MAVCSSLSAVSPYAVPKLSSNLSESRARVPRSTQTHRTSELYRNSGKTRLSTRLSAAGFAEIEPDLREDPHDRWETNSISMDDFKFGEYDDHHTYHEGEEKKGSFWGSIAEDIEAVGTPTGFQGTCECLPNNFDHSPTCITANEHDLFWLFRQGEYLYIGAGLFTIVFCIIEMDKPDKPHNFEPQIYNMERGARDKLIADYNTMDIWDFNEKYGDLWDFTVTVKKEDIMKR